MSWVMRNLEIKAEYRDHEKLEKLLDEFGARFIHKKRQIDTYFSVHQGRLKLREMGDRNADLIYYQRGESVLRRWSNYYLYPCSNPKELKQFLGRLFPVEVMVDKQRALYRYKNARIHVDRVRALGNFMEIEVEVKKGATQARKLMQELLTYLQIPRRHFITKSYSDLLLR